MRMYVFTRRSTRAKARIAAATLHDALLNLPHTWRRAPHDLAVTMTSCSEIDALKARCHHLEQQLALALRR